MINDFSSGKKDASGLVVLRNYLRNRGTKQKTLWSGDFI